MLRILAVLTVLLSACGPAWDAVQHSPCATSSAECHPGEGVVSPAPRAPATLEAVDVNGAFEAWSALNPAGCQAPWMDALTSWCSATAMPDGWSIRTGGAWGDMLTRGWEALEGQSSPAAVRHSLAVRGGCGAEPYTMNHCRPHVLAGPTFTASPGESFAVGFHLYRKPGFAPAPDGDPNQVTLAMEWLAPGCVELLGTASLPAPALSPDFAWSAVGPATLQAPPGTGCARVLLDVQPHAGGPLLDGVHVSRLR